jgi:hypothetical protein
MKKLFAAILVFSVFSLRSQAPVQEDKVLIIKMKTSQWEVVIKALRELPYKESGGPIDEILVQAHQQLNPPAPAKTIQKTDSTKKKP